MRHPLVAPLALVAALALAAAPVHAQSDSTPPAPAPSDPAEVPRSSDTATVVVTFENQAWNAVNVYVRGQTGAMSRLGMVEGFSRRTFRLPRTLVVAGIGNVEVIANLFASRRQLRTGEIPVTAGSRMEVTLPSSLNQLGIQIEQPD